MGKDHIKTLSAQVSTEEYKRYKELAETQGVSLSAWVKQSLAMMYPETMQATHLAAAKGTVVRAVSEGTSIMGVAPVAVDDTQVLAWEDALAASFHQLDRTDPDGVPRTEGYVPPQPTPGPQSVPVRESTHPCGFLNPTPPPNMLPGDCQGTCQKQRGRACHWAPQVARQCTYFRPK